MTSEYTKTYTGVLTAQDGTRRHFINGAPGRDGDLPAVEYPDGGVVFYRENPKRGGMGQRASLEHRNGGPAVEMAGGDFASPAAGHKARFAAYRPGEAKIIFDVFSSSADAEAALVKIKAGGPEEDLLPRRRIAGPLG